MQTNGTTEIKLDDELLTLEVEYSGWYDPGVCSGPPENCYPPEGEMEWHISRAWVWIEEASMDIQLTQDQIKEILPSIYDTIDADVSSLL